LVADGTLVEHKLSFPQRHNQYVHVTSTFPAGGGPFELSMPSWTPGSYLIRDFSAQVEALRAVGPSGQALEVSKTAKNKWLIDAENLPEITVDYDVWAGELNVSTSWIESGGALLNGAGIFLYGAGSRSLPQQVLVEPPGDWSAVYTSMEKNGPAWKFLARDYDELVDSPIVAGNFSESEFKVKGHPYALVLSPDNGLWEQQKAIDDVALIVKAQQEFWGVNPFDRKYLFINLLKGPFGGLEHDHSTVMMSTPWQMRLRKDYIKWLGLVSHEFFHAWNVRRMRPEVLSEYSYDSEVYTRELWLAEGLSSYYDDLLLFRSGLIDVGEYFELLANEIHNYEATPGRRVRSAELASFDTWIRQYKPDENSVNSTVSYYRKGALIGFVTDMAIRRQSKSRSSLDTVMRAMYEQYGPGGDHPGGYPPGAFEDRVESIAGTGVRKMVEDMLQTTNDPDVDEALAWYGLYLERKSDQPAADENGNPSRAGFGVVWDLAGTMILVERVLDGHSGAAAGLLPGDELLAIDGLRVTTDNFASLIHRFRPDEQVELTIARHDRLMALSATLQHELSDTYSILPDAKIRRSEKSRLESWLGRELLFKN
jgi:predicted metalloprotease with PDZ domain